MVVKDIANLIPAMQSVAMVGHNVKTVKKKDITTKDILGLGVTNIVGTSMVRATSGITAGL